MRLFSILFFVALLCTETSAQYRAGVKVSPGLGYTRSSDLKSYFSRQSHGGAEFSAANRMRAHVGLGGFVDYKITDEWYIVIEPVFTLASANLVSSFTADHVDEHGYGMVHKISSEARFRTNYLSVPLTARYRFNARRELYLTGGFVFNFNFRPTLFSEEKTSVVEYKEGIGDNYTYGKQTMELKMNDYNIFNLNLVIGAGKMFNRFGRNVFVDIRYSHPLTKSPLRTTGINEHLLLNNVYTGQSAKTFNDFKTGLFSLNIAVTLYKNYR